MKLDTIKRAVCKEFDVRLVDLIKASRLREKVVARQVAFYMARSLLGLSHREIGDRFDRDHTTVGFGIRQVKRDMRRNKIFGNRIARMARQLSAADA